jgi:membrane-associated phospholipid phosphatase
MVSFQKMGCRNIFMTTKPLILTPVQDRPAHKNTSPGLKSPGLFAKWPMLGFIMFIFGGLMFAGLTYNLLAQGPLLEWDKVLANTLPAIGLQSPAFVQTIMTAGFYMGEQAILVLSMLVGLYFLYKRSWQEFAMVAVGMTGSTLLFLFLSALIGRERPPTQIWIILNVPGFPSGHAIAVIVFYGLLAYLLVPKMPTAVWKGVVTAAALLMMGFVGFSRIFTGGHYLTDVLAGYAVGIAWSGVVFTLIEVFARNKKKGTDR